MLILDNKKFEINEKNSHFYIEKEGQYIRFMLHIECDDGEYEGEICGPSMEINWINTQAGNMEELVGFKVSVPTWEEADKREDIFYLFEHEPFFEYTLNIIESKDDKIHISIKGTAITDGYADPFIKAPFETDCWLTIKI